MISFLLGTLIVIHVVVCLLMVLVVLMQRPRSEGLGAAFGGGMTDSLFGAQTTHVLQRFTVWLGGAFFLITLLLAIIYAKLDAGPSRIQKQLLAEPVPISAPANSANDHAVTTHPNPELSPAPSGGESSPKQ